MTGIAQPISMRFLPDGRLLVAQKNGMIRIADVESTTVQWELYLDLASAQHADGIASDQERGLLDLTLDPGFPAEPYIYLYYTPATGANGPRARIARFTHLQNSGGTSSRASPSSEVVLWRDTDGYDNCCHFGGSLDFGPEGKLWLSVGDHFEGSYASSLQHAGGKIHRINKDGSIPADNPYIDGAGPNVDSTFAYGLRNPFRSRWDLPTGRYFIAEVGGNEQSIAWEDLHWIQYDLATGRFVDSDYGTAEDNGVYDGINFGWPTVEGLPPHDDFPGWVIDEVVGEPMFGYRHSDQNSAITGGVVYRGTQFPAEYQGAYFYADSTRRFVRYLLFDEDGLVEPNPNPNPVIDKKNPDTISYLFDPAQIGRVVALEESPDGSLYYATFADTTGGGNEPTAPGSVRRYVYDGGNSRPLIQSFDVVPNAGAAPLDVVFEVVATDPESDAMTYQIDFGDGQSTVETSLPDSVAVTVPHSYTVEGVSTAILTVSDGFKAGVDELEVSVGAPPVLTSFTSTNQRPGAQDDMFQFGDTITFAASATDGDGAPLGGEHFEWEVAFVRPETLHPSYGPESGTTSIDFLIPTQGQGFSGDVFYRCYLKITDDNGLETNATLDVYPEKANILFDTVPSGITIQVEGNTADQTPFVLDTLVNYDHTITAPGSICIGGREYAFSNWSNGPTTPQQVFTMPPSDVTLIASYIDIGTCSGIPSGGLVARFRSDAGVVLSGATVTTWEDQTSLNNHLAAAGAPTLVASQVNGRSAIHFDGVDDALVRSGVLGLPQGSQDRSVFLVARYNGVGAGAGWVGFAFGAASSNRAFGLTLTPVGRLGVQGWGSANDIVSSPPNDGVGAWLVQGAVLSGNVLTQYRDGNEIGVENHVYNTGATAVRLGEELNGNKNLDMDVAEILVYDRALSPNELDQVFGYFFLEYGIGSGPTNTAPTVAISAPADGSSFEEGTSISFSGSATDAEDGSLTASLVWSSDLDGPIGTGGSFSTSALSLGTHLITATATDSGGLPGQDAIGLTVTSPANTAPTVAISAPADGSSFEEGTSINFSGSATDAEDGSLTASLVWSSDLDGPIGSGGSFPTSALSLGTHLITATATDSGGLPGQDAIGLTVTSPANTAPTVAISAPADGSSFEQGTSIDFAGSATDAEDGSLTASLSWSSDLDGPIGTGGSFSTSALSLGTHVITATATDSGGLPGQDAIGLTVTALTDTPYAESLVLELDATQGVTATGGTVSAWNDLSGFNNHVFASGDPQLIASAVPSGLPAIALDGDGDALERIDAIDPLVGLPSANANRTLFLVARYHSAGAAGGAVYGNGAVNQAFGLGVRQTTGNLMLQGWGTMRDLHSSSLGIGAGWILHSGSLVSGVATHYRDGVVIGQRANTYNTVLSRLSIGREIAQLGYMQMDVAAFLIYDRALNAVERAEVEAYLREKFLEESATNTAPTVTISAPADGSSFEEGVSIDFSGSATDAEDGTLTASLSWSSDLDGAIGTGGSFSTGSLSEGTHVITATVTDSGGLPGQDTIGLTVTSPANAAPTVTISAPADGSSFEEGVSIDFAGTATDPEDGTLTASLSWSSDLDGAIGTGGSFSTGSLSEGTHVITASVTDSGGLPGQDAIGLTVTSPANAAPTVTISAPADGSSFEEGVSIDFSGSATDAEDGSLTASLSWSSDLDGAIGTGGSFSTGSLSEGTHVITATVTDSGGLPGQDTIGLTVTSPGNTAPTVAISAPADGSSFEEGVSIDFSGSATDAEDGTLTASLSWSSDLDGAIGTGGSFSTGSLSAGTHVVTATVTDSGGLPGQDAISLTVTAPTDTPYFDSLVLELDATQGVTESNGLVSAWNDLSGFNNHVFASGDPQLVALATPSGLPAIAFDGDGDALERNNATDPLLGLPAANAGRSMFLVARYHSAGAGGGAVYGNGAVNEAFGLAVRQSTGNLMLQGWGTRRDLHSSSLGIGTGWLMQSGTLNSGVATHYRDGAMIGQHANVYNTVPSRLSIAREISQLGYLQMDVAAVLVYDRALTDLERAEVESYLQQKYLAP